MRIGRTLPPAAAPIGIFNILSGVRGIFQGERELERFQSELKQYFGVKHCFLVSSGKAAFALTLLALRELFPDRDEVLIPAFTCYSVPSSIVRARLTVRLCDLAVNGFDFDFAQLSAMLSRISPPLAATHPADCASDSPTKTHNSTDAPRGSTKKVLAIVPTHLFGIPADVASIRRIVRDPEITIVEDAAQAMGETWEGRKLGTLGDVSFFSLGRGKAFSAVEGGIILTNRDDIAEALNHRVNSLPRYGFWELASLIVKAGGMMLFLHPLLFWIPRSIPFLRLGETLFEPHFPMLKMSSFQAGLARNWRKRIEALQDVRRKSVNRWIAVLEKSGISRRNVLGSHSRGLLRFPIRLDDQKKRETLLRESYRKGRGIMPLYPASVDAIPELKGTIRDGGFPVAESVARQLVTLPTHAYLTDDDVTKIGVLISRALG